MQSCAVNAPYACNGETVTYAVGERWCADADNLDAPPTETETRWAREFRYDGARQRYLNRPLDPTLFGLVQDLPGGEYVETVYDGDEAVRDKRNGGGLPGRLFSAGIARVEPFDPWNPPNGGDLTEYYHTDHLGTTRLMSDPSGNPIDFNGPADSGADTVYTAFGEPIVNTFADGGSNRYGYVGAHGYQSHDEMPFLHVGARYYDPSTGRFLQRDPIGIRGGINVYEYALSTPTLVIDPMGMKWSWRGFIGGLLGGATTGAVGGAVVGGGVGGVVGGIVGGLIGGIVGGLTSDSVLGGALVGGIAGGISGTGAAMLPVMWIGYGGGAFVFNNGSGWLVGIPGWVISTAGTPSFYLPVPVLFPGNIPGWGDPTCINCFFTMLRAMACGWGIGW